jgi:hypothetical protein
LSCSYFIDNDHFGEDGIRSNHYLKMQKLL